MIPKDIKERVLAWNRTPLRDRSPRTQTALANELGIPVSTVNRWISLERVKPDDEEGKEYDSVKFLKSRTAEADEALIASVKKGSPQNQRLFNQLIGRLVEKQELTVKRGYNADELAAIEFELERRRREEITGVAESRVEMVQGESRLLPEEIRDDSGQIEGNNSVAIVASSSEAS